MKKNNVLTGINRSKSIINSFIEQINPDISIELIIFLD